MSKRPGVAVIGVGASAGGLEALSTLIEGLKPSANAAYVIVQHLSPDQKSILHELLQGHTKMPVTQITDGDLIEPNHIFVVPPGTVLRIEDDTLRLAERDSEDQHHRPIDAFFSSLAEARRRDAYCVVLSGTGSDGSAGLRNIKAAGGFALVQESKGARFPGMPDSAVATGLVDFVLPVSQIAQRLCDIIAHRKSLYDGDDSSALKGEIEEALPRLTRQLDETIGHDFTDYKPGTLVRRTERRMSVLRTRDIDGYIEMLQDRDEADMLAQEFLIGVTQFFRDPEAFDSLREKVVLPLLDETDSGIRVWVPGCCTGEEAYSIAMLLIEEMETRKDRRLIQVFGTDIDAPSLVAARTGLYSAAAVEGLSTERLERFFVIENGQYRARPQLREVCVFAPHNLLQDPPFSRLDLISCRNLLIYLSTSLQKQIVPRFHFALRGAGYLFLGPSEGLAGEDGLFETLDKTNRIFQRNTSARTTYSPLLDRPRKSSVDPKSTVRRFSTPDLSTELSREAAVERDFLRRFAAPFALLSEGGNVLFLSQQMTRFVRPAHGTPSTVIDVYLATELRVPVRTALAEAASTASTAVNRNVMVLLDDATCIYDVTVEPSGGDYLLVLTEVRAVDAQNLGDALGQREVEDRDILETENVQLRKQLGKTLEEFESSGQELKSSNEELMSMNEELQSSNEELETSREELQSINEELETVNAELQENNRLLTRANSDLKNLFESTDLAILFLDREFCVRNFTPSVARLFGIRDRDIGRPISDLSSRVNYLSLEEDARKVDETLRPLEREVTIDVSGETYQLQIKPYRTTDNRLDGYVLSFVDITQRKIYEETLRRNEKEMARQYAELENLYDTTPVGLALMSSDLRWVRINETMAHINGFQVDDHIGKSIAELLPDISEAIEAPFRRVIETGMPALNVEISGETHAAPGERRYWIGDYYPVWQDGDVFAVGTCVREVTDQTRMLQRIQAQNEHQTLLLAELQHRVKNTLATVNSISKLLLRDVESAEEYQSRLQDRVGAMSRTHDLLTESDWTSTTFREILTNEATPYARVNGRRLKLSGPDLPLVPAQAMTLGLGLHELMTNAAKHGALFTDDGTITIEVERATGAAEDSAHIVWKERGGPPIESDPKRRGFGSVILERVIQNDLDGEVTFEFEPDGLRFEVRFNLGETGEGS